MTRRDENALTLVCLNYEKTQANQKIIQTLSRSCLKKVLYLKGAHDEVKFCEIA